VLGSHLARLTDPAFGGSAAVASLWRARSVRLRESIKAGRDVGLAESGFATRPYATYATYADKPFPLPAFVWNFPIIGMAKTFDQAVLAGTFIDFANYFSPREMSGFLARV
jgi:hypothetical protein